MVTDSPSYRARTSSHRVRNAAFWVLTCAAVVFAFLPAVSAPAAGPTVVSLTFNDGHVSQFSYARPVLQAHQMTATFYVASGWVTAGSNSSMSWGQVRTLYRDGDEIGGMGTDHRNLTTIDAATQQTQVCGDRQTLITQGVDPQTFAYPGAGVNATAEATVQGCGYLAARTIGGLAQPTATTGPWAEPIPPTDRYAIRTAFVPTGAITLAQLQADVNQAAAKGGGWLPISFNQVCHAGTSTYSTCMASSKPIDDAVLSQFLDWLQSGAPAGTTVRTVRDVMGAPAPPPLPLDPTVVSLTFNDAYKSQYTYARPLLNAHNLRGTFYEPSGWIDQGGSQILAWWQLDDLYRDGNEIGGMGVNHKDLTTLDAATQQQEVCNDRQRLTQQGYDPQTFAYPAGAFNVTTKSTVSGCGYQAARASGGLSASGPTYAETLPPKDALAIRTVTTSSPITLADLQNAVNAAAGNGGGWVPLTFNQVCRSSDAGYSTCMASSRPIDEQVFSSFLAWLDGGGAPAGTTVKTVRDAMGITAQPPLANRPTTVSLTFDDGLVSQNLVPPVLASHGYHGSFFINTGPVERGEPGTMTWAQIAALQAAGHDVGGHTIDHVNLKTTTDYDTKYHQVCDDRADLIQHGFNPVSFAYPEAAFDATAEEIVRLCGYQTGRTGGSVSPTGPLYAETIPPRDPYATRVLGTTYDGPITLASLQDAVSAASSHGGGWLQTLFHQVCQNGTSGFDTCMAGYRPVDLATLQAFVDWLANGAPSGVSVKSVAEVMGVAPLVTIATPASGATVGGTTQFSGTADPSGGNVSVTVYSGSYPKGIAVATATAATTGGSWSATLSSALASGTYTVSAAQTRGGLTGVSVPTTFTVDSSIGAPTAAFTVDKTSGTAPLAVQFTDTSTGGPTSWAWDFGDTTSATTQNPAHTYTTPGTYQVTLTATNTTGSTTSAATTITVSSAPVAPTAAFTVDKTSGTAPLAVQFTDTSTGGPTSWAWDFGDTTSATTQNPAHTYTTPGTYQVTLTATNTTGSTTSAATTITVSSAPVAPTATFTVDKTSGTAPLAVQFTDTSTGGPTSWAWDFGDTTSATTQNPAHTYTTPGTYQVTLTATNTTGSTTSAATTITVSPAPVAPTATFTVDKTSGTAPLAVQFTDTSTGTPTSWAWDFGDTTSATTQNPAHTYTTPGTYQVTLTATNTTGSTTSAATTITVTKAPIQARSSSTASGSNTTVAVPRPAGVVTGDVLVVEITSEQNPTMTAVPAGWTAVTAAPLTVGTTARVWSYVHVVTNAATDPASYTWTLSARLKWAATMTAFSGVDNANPIDVPATSATTTTAATTLTVPGVSTVTAGAMLVSGLGLSANGITASGPAGWTIAAQTTGTQKTGLAYRLTGAAAASGNLTWSLSKATTAGGWLVALRPAP
ncbi:PKD domain-containing protein [Petropleomorpha daqingensis]|uniref:PKD repeat protein/peptidoglycan/xylan/chitin deacetylase (PgdA/CDA1 family) n=1 Tax=Petropleomorpha daqingensis TaxID=2026353 RepID=A0A853CCU0_9ACTN|nr:PKD repeat protein/peptidoglycan/xylan/chitin deacetylase (PgdA/CDA1 family) [Petropleomorpha daqingensis]